MEGTTPNAALAPGAGRPGKIAGKIVQRDRAVFCAAGYALVTLYGLLCVLPFVLVLVTSFTSEAALMRHGYTFFIKEFSLEAYRLAFRNPQRILWAYRNTVCATAVGSTLAVLIATMTGYVLQRKDFPQRNKFSLFFFFTTLFNGGLVPTYILCARYLKFRNNYIALVLPLMFSVWNMIIAKSYIKSIPFEITESAKVDGANDVLIFYRLILPLCKPLIATLGLFSALAYWNDWYNTLLYITKEERMSLQYFLQEMINSIQALKNLVSIGATVDASLVSLPQETLKMGMTVITTGPIILLYPFVQRYFVKGLTIGAVKG
ncbi:MAG: carbohydrate ABC transporter permease [Clostridiales bacterium]|jgi:putative aldouronate transport system permease protein|nr:carbohydrate ABC transporter permease [Clostridiales bacterium]